MGLGVHSGFCPTHGHSSTLGFCPVLNNARPCVLCHGASPAPFLSPAPHGRHHGRCGPSTTSSIHWNPLEGDIVSPILYMCKQARRLSWSGRGRAGCRLLVSLALKPVHGAVLSLAEFDISFCHPQRNTPPQGPTCSSSWCTLISLPFLLPPSRDLLHTFS